MPSGHVYEVRQNNDTQRGYGVLGYLNTSTAMVALMDQLGDKILVRDVGTTRDQVYAQAKKFGRKVGITKVKLMIGDTVHSMLEVELTALDDNAKNFRHGDCETDD
jgi:hypothetical protein